MKIALYLILFTAMVLMGCDDRLRNRDRNPACADPIADHDPNRLKFQNVDRRPLYLALGILTSGDQSNTLAGRAELGPGASISLPFSNQAFNHYYFYRDQSRQQLIACLIIQNTQPNNVCIAPLQVMADGNFPASQLKVTNLRTPIAIREITMPAWQIWDGENPSSGSRHQLDGCIATFFRTTPSSDFRHAYFYQKFTDGSSYPFSQVIYRITNTSKIQFNSIVIK